MIAAGEFGTGAAATGGRSRDVSSSCGPCVGRQRFIIEVGEFGASAVSGAGFLFKLFFRGTLPLVDEVRRGDGSDTSWP